MRFATLAVVLLLASAPAHAGDCLTLPPDADDTNQFVGRVIDSLESFASAREKLESIGKSKSETDFIATLVFAGQDLDCADKSLMGFDKSKNEAVKGAVYGFRAAAFVLKQTNEQFRTEFVAALNGTPERSGDRANRIATIRVQASGGWDSLVTATTAAVFGLVEFDATGTMKRLALTSPQRAALVKRLVNSFPMVAKKGAKGGPVESAAGVLYDILANKKWRSHEQPFIGGSGGDR
jgi:hypothetical protein